MIITVDRLQAVMSKYHLTELQICSIIAKYKINFEKMVEMLEGKKMIIVDNLDDLKKCSYVKDNLSLIKHLKEDELLKKIPGIHKITDNIYSVIDVKYIK